MTLAFFFLSFIWFSEEEYNGNSNSIFQYQPHVAIYATPTHSNSYLHQEKLIQLIQASWLNGSGIQLTVFLEK